MNRLAIDEEDSYIEIGEVPDHLRVGEELFEQLWDEHPEERGKVKMMGKVMEVKRYFQSYGRNYYFSGMDHNPVELTPFHRRLIEFVSGREGIEYNSVLVNWYDGGDDYIGPHKDNVKRHVQGSPIYSFSFGEKRDFVIKHDVTGERHVISLKDNTLLIMGGNLQAHYKHSVPVRKRANGRRVNMTVRAFV